MLKWLGVYLFAFMLAASFSPAEAQAQSRSLKLYNVHTKEKATITYYRNGRYDMRKINRFLRDWRRNEPTKMSPKLMDLIWKVYRKAGGRSHIHVVSAYRSPATNAMLRRRRGGQAKKSQHMVGNAMDFYIPGVSLRKLRDIGLREQVGGVGYYPRSGSPFVHMDVGRVRHWPRMSRSELSRVFPKGKTLHVPSDGKPLPGYQTALRTIGKNGRAPTITAAERRADQRAERTKRRNPQRNRNQEKKEPGPNLLARIFAPGPDDEEDRENIRQIRQRPARGVAPAAPAVAEPAPADPSVLVAALPQRAAVPTAAPRPQADLPENIRNLPQPEITPVVPEPPAALERGTGIQVATIRGARPGIIRPKVDLTDKELQRKQELALALAKSENDDAKAFNEVIAVPRDRNAEAAAIRSALGVNEDATATADVDIVIPANVPLPPSRPGERIAIAALAPSSEEQIRPQPSATNVNAGRFGSDTKAPSNSNSVLRERLVASRGVKPSNTLRTALAKRGGRVDRATLLNGAGNQAGKAARPTLETGVRAPKPVVVPAVAPVPQRAIKTSFVADDQIVTGSIDQKKKVSSLLTTKPNTVIVEGFRDSLPTESDYGFNGKAVEFLNVARFGE